MTIEGGGRTALFIGAHPPGAGSGSSARGLITLRTLMRSCSAVDAVAFATAEERAFAAPGTQFIERPPLQGSRSQYVRTVLTSGTLYYPERQAGLVDTVAERVASGDLRPDYDLVWTHSSLMARAALECFSARRFVLDIDNVAGVDARRAATTVRESLPRNILRRLDARAVGREERRRIVAFGDVVVSSEREKQLLGPIPARVRVVPNTVDGPDRPYDAGAGHTLLFVGNLQYDVNIDAIRYLIAEIVPRVVAMQPEARLVIAGRSPGDVVRALAQHPAVDLIANADSLEPYYRGARAIIAPLRTGGGTRIKVLEAMARGTPMVLTPEAAEGLDLRAGRDAFIERDAEALAARAAELVANPERARTMGEAGRLTWEAQHRPEVAMERISAIVTPAPERSWH